jgi:hypothetical protein
MDNFGILGQLMDLSHKVITNQQNWDGGLMRNKFLKMLFSIDKDAKLLFT